MDICSLIGFKKMSCGISIFNEIFTPQTQHGKEQKYSLKMFNESKLILMITSVIS